MPLFTLQRVASILVCLQVDVTSANQTRPSSRPQMCIMRDRSCSLKPAVIFKIILCLSIQHDTYDELCAVRKRLSSEELGDSLGEAPKEALPPGSLCVLLSGVALGRRCLDCSLIYRRLWDQTELLIFPRDTVAEQ